MKFSFPIVIQLPIFDIIKKINVTAVLYSSLA